MDIAVLGYAGLSGSRKIFEIKRDEIEKRYCKSFLRVLMERSDSESSVYPLVEKALDKGLIRDAEEAREGGVLAALWRLLDRNRLGCEYSMRKIPILQQTVELCEMYGLDPYRLSSEGCMVCLCENERELKAFMEKAGAVDIPLHYIGRTEKGKARKRTDGAETAYLRRPEPDELLKINLTYSGDTTKGD